MYHFFLFFFLTCHCSFCLCIYIYIYIFIFIYLHLFVTVRIIPLSVVYQSYLPLENYKRNVTICYSPIQYNILCFSLRR